MPNSRTAELIALIRAHVSPAPADISPDPVPSNATFPYVTVSEPSAKESESLTGPSGICHCLAQISCWDKNYESAWAMRQAVKTYLLSFKGAAGTQTISGVNHYGDRELYDGVRSLHQHITRLWIWWTA